MIIDTVYWPGSDTFSLNLYADNLSEFSDPQREDLMVWIHNILLGLNSIDGLKVTVEVHEYAPKM